MAAARDDFMRHCTELLGSAGAVRTRRMFGGHGLYLDDLFVAIVFGERLYLKTDTASRARFEAAGGLPFVYDAKGQAVSMSYFSAPDDAMESPAQMRPWARLALEAALRARAAKPRPTPAAKPAKARKVSARTSDGKV
jgi:DNA transformation protein